MKQIMDVSIYTIQYMTGMSDPDFFDDLNLTDTMPFSSYNSDIYKNTSGKSPGYYVMTFPYTLYYRL
jgi:hypothetical protein